MLLNSLDWNQQTRSRGTVNIYFPGLSPTVTHLHWSTEKGAMAINEPAYILLNSIRIKHNSDLHHGRGFLSPEVNPNGLDRKSYAPSMCHCSWWNVLIKLVIFMQPGGSFLKEQNTHTKGNSLLGTPTGRNRLGNAIRYHSRNRSEQIGHAFTQSINRAFFKE